MSTRKILTTMSFAALFAGAAMAAEPTKTLESIENVESFDVASGEYVQASGAYYRDGGLPDGTIHKGPVVNVGSMSIDGTFEVKASDQDANRLFDVIMFRAREKSVSAEAFTYRKKVISRISAEHSLFLPR